MSLTTTLCLVVALCPQGGKKSGGLVLPPPAVVQPKPATADQLSEADRFAREVFAMRRSARLPETAEEIVLRRIGHEFPRAGAMAMRQIRSANTDIAHALLRVLSRYGQADHAVEMEYLLLTRPFGPVTRDTVKVLVSLHERQPDRAAGLKQGKAALMRCLSSRYARVRKVATDQLLARLEKIDLPSLLELADADDADIRRKALYLLGALPYPESQQRLVRALSVSDPTTAGTACQSLIEHGPGAAAQLQEIVGRPAGGRSYGYAAFALSEIENRTGQVLLTDDMRTHLLSELRGADEFTRTATALALANMAFRSPDTRGLEFADREVVDGLLLVVAPRGYVSNLSMLQKSASRRIVEFCGVDHRGRNEAWHAWWEKARPTFVGMRLQIQVTPEAGDGAWVTWADHGRTLRFGGITSGVSEVKKLKPGEKPRESEARSESYLLTGSEMASLVDRLKARGFMSQGLATTAAGAAMLPVARSLELRLGGSRCRVQGPAPPAPWLDGLATEIETVAARERWQLYRDPDLEHDRITFWQREREWLAAHPDRLERDRRLVERILTVYPKLETGRREQAVAHILALPEPHTLIAEKQAMRLLDVVEKAQELDAEAFRLVELAMLAGGARVADRLLSVVDSHHDTGGKAALPRVFSLLGAEQVRAAVDDERPRVRVAAILEVANLKDRTAVPRLVAALESDDVEVVEAAVYSLGMLGAVEVRDTLLEMETAPDARPSTRRVLWVALGRIGGKGIFQILQSSVASPDLADQLAAIRALGELDEAGAAHFLAQVFVAQGNNPRGTQAMASLQRMGGLLAAPALRRHLGVADPRARREIVMLLADFQDPIVVPDLLDMLEVDRDRARATLLLAGITGLDLTGENNRAQTAETWWRSNRDLPQAAWFLAALRRAEVPTNLRIEQLSPGAGAGAVPELTRIMLEVERPHLRVLSAALLRDTTRRDFGLISMQTAPAQLQAVADRYRFFAEAENERGR